MGKPRNNTADLLTYWASQAIFAVMLRLPYRLRIPLMGRLMTYVVAPIAGYRRRIRNHLKLALPDLDRVERQRLLRAIPDNIGRTLIEIYSGREFQNRCADLRIAGDGAADLERAHREGTPALLITAHFGNYDAIRAALGTRGYNLAALYMRMSNPYFHQRYLKAISAYGPVFERGREGLTHTIRHLKSGGMMGMLVDIRIHKAEVLSFFGQPALTATNAAEMALKYNAPLIPVYAVRQPDGLSFELIAEAPITGDDPVAMTQALNDSLEALVRKHPDQWFWVHKRWRR